MQVKFYTVTITLPGMYTNTYPFLEESKAKEFMENLPYQTICLEEQTLNIPCIPQ